MIGIRGVLGNQRGFSLTELLVVCAILGLILAAIVGIQQSGQQAYLFGASRVEVQQKNRVALEMMTRELRSSLSITALGATDLTFTTCKPDRWYAVPPTTCQPADQVTVRYYVDGTTLTLNRTFDGVTKPLIGGMQLQPPSLVITYYATFDAAHPTTAPTSTTTDPTKVTVIRIQLSTRPEETTAVAGPAYQQSIMDSTIRLRNP